MSGRGVGSSWRVFRVYVSWGRGGEGEGVGLNKTSREIPSTFGSIIGSRKLADTIPQAK